MKKKIFLLMIVLLTVVSIPVFAKGNKGFYADDELNLKKSIDTTSFVAGNNIEMSSKVDGLNFVAGNNISLSSTQDHLFAAGNNLRLEGVSTKDAFLAGNMVSVDNSNIRDLYVAAATIRIDSNISRNAYIGGDKVTINSVINGDVKIAADNIRIGKEAIINGTLLYPEEAKISISDDAIVETIKTYKGTSDIKVQISIVEILIGAVYRFLSLLIIGFVLLAIHKRLFKHLKDTEKSPASFFKNLAIGFISLIVIPIASIIAMITVIGIPLALITLVLYVILIYLSSITTAYYVGRWIFPDKNVNDYLLLGCSLLALTMLRIIPIISGLVTTISLFVGLGLFITTMKKMITEKK